MPELIIKGWMLDAARLPEPLPYYRRVIDLCAGWGFNTILFRVADDQGSALRFTSHPELVTHPQAYSAADLAGLAAYASSRGIDLIPEVESFGHTGFITRSPEHAHLLDAQPGVDTFTGVIPNHPETMAILDDLYREVAAIFPSRYLHAGCDEVNWGGSAYSRAAIAERGRAGVWSEHLRRLNGLARSHSKELMIWADHVLGGEESPALLKSLPRDVILVDWNYWENEPARSTGWDARGGPIQANARRALEGGFRLVGAPAWGWCRWGVRAGESQLRNVDAFADIYRAIPDQNCQGVIVTNWVPSRFIQGAIWDAPAYAGAALTEGSGAARRFALPRFVAAHYGAQWDATWADVFRTLYQITPPRRGCSPAWMAPFQPPVWSDADGLAAVAHAADLLIALDLPFVRLKEQLAVCGAGVRENLADFQSFVLAVETLEHIHWRCAVVRDAALTATATAKTGDIIKAIARRDAALLEALEGEWERNRFPNTPARDGLLADLSVEDQTLYSMRKAAAFTAELTVQPERFAALVG